MIFPLVCRNCGDEYKTSACLHSDLCPKCESSRDQARELRRIQASRKEEQDGNRR